MKRAVVATALAVLAAASCGGDETTSTPATTVPETTVPEPTVPETTPATSAAEAMSLAGVDGDAAAPAEAWAAVFDSAVPFAEKSVYLADAAALESTVEAYEAAAEGFGGISLVPTGVVIEGDTAEITYDVKFGGNPAYGDQIGTIELVDGVWTVSRAEFCAFMSSARVGCP